MNWLSSIWSKEPAAITGGLMALIYIAVAFGAPISPDQQEALQENLPLVLGLLGAGAVVTRQSVFSPHTVETEVKPEAFVQGVEAATTGLADVDNSPASIHDAELRAAVKAARVDEAHERETRFLGHRDEPID